LVTFSLGKSWSMTRGNQTNYIVIDADASLHNTACMLPFYIAIYGCMND
jgi:hypothetical protein